MPLERKNIVWYRATFFRAGSRGITDNIEMEALSALTPAIHLPAGVRIHTLQAHDDERGTFLELFREEWETECHPIQWNAVHSSAGVLRGVHVHVTHSDYLVVVSGAMLLGLHDLRPENVEERTSCMLTLDARHPVAVAIPPGVCHGFYFPTATTHVYAVTSYWNTNDELGCQYNAPDLNLAWPTSCPILSERDQSAKRYEQMRQKYLSLIGENNPVASLTNNGGGQ